MALYSKKISLPLLLTIGSCLGLIACESTPSKTPKNPLDIAFERGRTVYQTQCTACHNSDPKKPGSIGPDVAGSSRELLEARILRAEYPPNYRAKRETHQMVALPHLKGEIEALAAYLK